MKIADCSFTNNDTEYNLIKELLLELGTALAKECFKRLSILGVERVTIASLAEPNVSDFLYESLNPVSVKRAYRYSLNLDD